MAASATRSGNSGIFWMNGVSDEEQPLVFVPGVGGEAKTQTPFSFRPECTSGSIKGGSKMRARRSPGCKNELTLKKSGMKQGDLQSECSGVYTKEKAPVHHRAPEHSLPQATGPFHPLTQVISETSRAKSLVCLKDLCPEDKRRIANLIEELARVSEEKEESVQRLKDEQGQFERKIQQLEQQNVVIAQERESLQQQYRECQELLQLYQQYLSQQQAKLNQSIAQLSQEPTQTKVLSSEEAPSRTSTSRSNGSAFDGSYLGFAARQPRVDRSCHTCGDRASHSSVTHTSPTNGTSRSQNRERMEPRSESHRRCERCQGCGQNNGYGTQQQRSGNDSRLEDGLHHTFNQHQCERLHSGSGATGTKEQEGLTRPLLGHEDWEEKRHQLLLQKMQLEVERERLQTRLAEQEEKLSRQNQQLQQSRLDYSRIQQATQSDLNSSGSRNPQGPPHQDLPSSVHEDTEVRPAGRSLHEKRSQTEAASPVHGGEALERSMKDTATSPAKSPASLSKPTSVSVNLKTPEARLDFSVVELLDIFSPVAASELSRMSTRRPKASQRRLVLTAPKPVGRPLLTPARPFAQHNPQDLEESQILEDIFFIC